ncbi:hypothetical protein ABIC16_001797 [Sphingomonas sp. PvP055]|uniref:hypothetical protein n=1 Tax=Sphingomonas sp. PvP055 TaxID=3156391 RepID=UPI003391F3FD
MVDRHYSFFIVAIVAVGLLLRIAAAQGGLWLDEAWSAEFARQAGTPLGVLLSINHDNNHHLTSLWLLAVGEAAAPVVQRALSIVTGTIGIIVAAEIVRPRNRGVAVIAAALFAVTPILVTMGSEARGYAGMTLALLTAILLVDRWLVEEHGDRTAFRLGLCFLLGALSQLTMVFGCVALVGWTFVTLAQRHGAGIAARRTLALFAAPLLVLAAVLGLVAVAALASPAGFQIGSYIPFQRSLFVRALTDVVGYTVGWAPLSAWAIVPVLILVAVARRAGARHVGFYSLAIVAFPAMLVLLQIGNTGYPRYYMLTAVALLLLMAETLGIAVARGGWRRGAALAVLAAMLSGGLWQDAALIRNQRGDPDRAIAALRARAPGGATVLLDPASGLAILRVAAARRHYPIAFVMSGCRPARFLFAHYFAGESVPLAPIRCGVRYRPIASATAQGLSGTHWTLYERRP